MRKTRGSVAVGIAMLAAGALAGCAAGGGGGSTSSSDETLTIVRWAGPHADASVELLKQFTEETGIKVRVDAIDYAQLKQKQTLAMQNKTGEYDLIYVPEAWYQEYNAAGYLEPLTDYIAKDDAIKIDDFIPTSIDITSSDGVVYGLPDFLQTDLLVYDKDALAAKGLKPPTTWEESLAVAKAFKDDGTGIAMPGRQGNAIVDLLGILAKGNGNAGGLFTDDGKLDLTSDAVVGAATYLQDIMKDSVEGSTGWHYDETTKAIQFGQAPIGICISGLFSIAEDSAQSTVAGKLGYAPLPYNQDVSGFLATWNYSIPASSNHKDDAYKLAEWLTSKKTQTEMIQAFPGHLSLRNSVFEDPSLADLAPWLPTVKETLDNATTPPLQENGSKLVDALGAGLNGLFVNGGDPAEMLAGVQKDLQGDF